MALLIEKRSGMQNIFLQANCKMHEANYPMALRMPEQEGFYNLAP